jgi:acetyltransferase-like isoleucine patch superfamily enzyme
MQNLIIKILHYLNLIFDSVFSKGFYPILFSVNGVQVKSFSCFGIPYMPIALNALCFIGACSFISKGVAVGNNSIRDACPLVTKNIPENEIWAGNPVLFSKTIQTDEE